MSEPLYRDEPSHDGEVCNDCGRGYDDVYYVDDDLWALLHERAPGGTLCPSCLTRRALNRPTQETDPDDDRRGGIYETSGYKRVLHPRPTQETDPE